MKHFTMVGFLPVIIFSGPFEVLDVAEEGLAFIIELSESSSLKI